MPTNPAMPRSSPVSSGPGGGQGFAVPGRVVAAGRGIAWIGEGWELFKAAPALWIVMLLLWAGLQVGLARLPVLGSIASVLLGPVLLAGLVAFARGLQSGAEPDITLLLTGFRDRPGPLMTTGLLNLALLLAVALISVICLVLMVGGSLLTAPAWADPGHALRLLSGAGLGLLIAMLVAAGLLALVAAAYWFAPALVLCAGLGAGEAMRESFRACMHNWRPFLVYSLASLLLILTGAACLGVGLLVALPVLAASYYASFHDIFGEPPA